MYHRVPDEDYDRHLTDLFGVPLTEDEEQQVYREMIALCQGQTEELPSQADIAAAREEAQAEWSEQERRRRAKGMTPDRLRFANPGPEAPTWLPPKAPGVFDDGERAAWTDFLMCGFGPDPDED